MNTQPTKSEATAKLGRLELMLPNEGNFIIKNAHGNVAEMCRFDRFMGMSQADAAAIIVRAVNLLEAHEAVANAVAKIPRFENLRKLNTPLDTKLFGVESAISKLAALKKELGYK